MASTISVEFAIWKERHFPLPVSTPIHVRAYRHNKIPKLSSSPMVGTISSRIRASSAQNFLLSFYSFHPIVFAMCPSQHPPSTTVYHLYGHASIFKPRPLFCFYLHCTDHLIRRLIVAVTTVLNLFLLHRQLDQHGRPHLLKLLPLHNPLHP